VARVTGLGLLRGIALALATFLFAAHGRCADAPQRSQWEATIEAMAGRCQ